MQRYLIVSAVLFLIFMVSCGTGNKVFVREFTPKGEVDELTTFTIEFSEDLAPADQQNKWLTDEFVTFEPKIDGKFKWVSGSTLIFSPDYKLEPIQKYKATITDKVLFDKEFDLDADEYDFHTPYFDATKADFFWTRVPNRYYTMSIQANVYFNYAVQPSSVKEYLTIELDGKPIDDYTIENESSSDVIAINIGEVEQTDKEKDVVVKIKKGLESVMGKMPMQEAREFEHELPPITKLAVTGVSAGYDGDTGWIEVSTTQTVDEKRIDEFVSIKPQRNLRFMVNDNRFRIEADLANLNTVELKVEKGLPGLYGGELEFDFEQVVSLVEVKPGINFADKKGKYLMLGGNKLLQVNAVNVPGLDVEVSKVYKNNLLHFLNRYSYTYSGYNSYYNPNYYVENYGKLLYEKNIRLSNRKNWIEEVDLDLEEALNKKYKGIYVVNVRSEQDRWINDSKMLAMSDLGIIAKKGTDQITVFVNSIATTEPVGGVEVSVISTNNQIILHGTTDQTGVVKFIDTKTRTEGFNPRLIVAEKGKDFNYIDLQETFVEKSRYDVGGLFIYSDRYNVFMYSERNLYRPGERVNLSGIIRSNDYKVIEQVPVIIKVIAPTGKVFEEYKKNLNKESSFELSFDVPDYVPTGEYTAEVYTGAKELIGSYKFSIEEFVPDKIRVTLNNDREKLYPGETVNVEIDAEFLFGAKAAGLKYEVLISFRNGSYTSEKYPKFDFSNSSVKDFNFPNENLEGKLDDNGKASFSYIVPYDIMSGGVITATAYVSVFDLTGRTVNRAAAFDIYPKKYFIGINAPGYYFGTNENLNFELAAVNPNDEPVKNFNAAAKLLRYEWHTVLKKDNNDRYYYDSEKKEVVEWERDVKIDGKPEDFTFSVSRSGNYDLRVYKKGEDNYVSKNFYAYGWGGATASSFEVDKEGRIDIAADKKTYEPGETAKVLFMAPFSGKMLVTIERDGVYDYRYVDVEEKSFELELPITDSYLPNVYVSATLFRPHNTEDNTPFLVGHGYASLKVQEEDNRIEVTIDAPDKIKPNRTQKIEVETDGGADTYVTLAVVDEGILQIKGFETPSPYDYMYAKRPLKVDGYDLYKLLLPELIKEQSLTGGDMLARAMQKRTNPITTKRFKLMSYWSGIKKTDSGGDAVFNVTIPQFNGEVRIMAVVYKGNKFGSGDERMKIADDIIIEPEVPRFLAPGDSLNSTVTVINTTDGSADVELSASVEKPLKLASASEAELDIEPNKTGKANFAINVDNEIGKSKIVFEADGADEVKEEIEIGVRPTSPLIVETGSGSIKAGSELVVDIPANFMEGTQNTQLTISKFPAVKFAKHLKYLVGYPHGCLEQTVSKLFPQLYFDALAKLVAPEMYGTTNPAYYVKEGIRKIESLQLYDGSLAFWQGGTKSNWWGSVYAANFLVEANKAGYDVNDDALQNLMKYLTNKARSKETYDYVTYEGNKRTVKKIARKEIIYTLYVLALAGKGDISTMNYYKARPHLLSSDTKYLLAGAYGLMGKMNSYDDLMPKQFDEEKTVRMTGFNFDSSIRANAIKLNVLLEVDPNNGQIPYIIRYLTGNAESIYTTQDRAFAFMGLGKAAQRNADANVKIAVNVNGSTIANYDNKDLTLDKAELNGASITLKAAGNGEVYYFWETEGIKVNAPVPEEDNGLMVRREYYNYRTGQKINGMRFNQGDLIQCRITLNSYNRNVDNIVISDLLPAGFEVENPRLSGLGGVSGNENTMNVEFLDVRDDRLLIFTSIPMQSKCVYTYLLRVVNKGEFKLPVISAEAMYDRELHSYNGAGVINVK